MKYKVVIFKNNKKNEKSPDLSCIIEIEEGSSIQEEEIPF